MISSHICVQGDEVPEEALPEPFYQLKKGPNPIQSTRETFDMGMVGQTVKASHLSVSFKSQFSQRRTIIKEEKASVSFAVNSHLGSTSTSLPETPMKCINPTKDSSQNFIETTDVSITPVDKVSSGSTPLTPLPETPVKCIDPKEGKDQSSFETTPSVLKTPVDHAFTPIKLMSATPALRPPKRCYMSPDDNSSILSNKLARRPPNRPLTFGSPVKKSVKKDDDKFGSSNILSTDKDIYDILPEDLLQSVSPFLFLLYLRL